MLRTLARAQAVEVAADKTARAAPGRAIEYRITRKGRARLRELALRAWSAPVGDFASIQVAYAVRHELEADEVRAGLAHRIERVQQELGGIDALARRAFDAALVARMKALLIAERDWLLQTTQGDADGADR